MAGSNMHGYSRPKRDEAEQGSDKQKDGIARLQSALAAYRGEK